MFLCKCTFKCIFVSVFFLSVPSFTHLLSFVSLFNDENKPKDVSKGKGCVSVLGGIGFGLLVSVTLVLDVTLVSVTWHRYLD